MTNLLHYREFGVKNAPSLKEQMSDYAYPEQDIVAKYLESGKKKYSQLGMIKDAFTGAPIEPKQPITFLTDGEYTWTNDLAYYVKKYHVRLPKDFETKALSCQNLS